MSHPLPAPVPARLALVILAAGASERLGECKALVRLAGRSVLERLLSAGDALGAEPPALVVAGADHEALSTALEQLADARAGARFPPELALNAGWVAGRTGSVRLAWELRPGCALCLAPVDVPLVPPAVFAALGQAWRAAGAPPRGWLAPRAEDGRGAHGHPVVVGPELLAQAFQGDALGPDTPLRRVRELAAPRLSVPVPGREVLEDLDTPLDLARIRSRLGGTRT